MVLKKNVLIRIKYQENVERHIHTHGLTISADLGCISVRFGLPRNVNTIFYIYIIISPVEKNAYAHL